MHMADALLSPGVSAAMAVAGAAAVAYSVAGVNRESGADASGLYGDGDRKVPVMGVMGAFVFAAQMINFTIPATGSSGHIAGGLLLATMLGPCAAFLTLAVVLIIQCLFFADGGLMALGCNIFNMGFYSCFIAYPLIFKPIAGRGMSAGRVTAASIAASVTGLQLGAFSVVLETLASGVTELPFSAFVMLMQPIHLAIGVIEGLITAAVICFVSRMRPEMLEFSGGMAGNGEGRASVSFGKVLCVLLALAALTGGLLSLYASANPDGLEWSMERTAGTAELERDGGAYAMAAKIQETTAFMPDYTFRSGGEEGSALGTSASGIAGGALTLLAAAAAGAVITAFRRQGHKNAS